MEAHWQPIFKLPTEILSIVSLWHRDIYWASFEIPFTSDPSQVLRANHRWVKITHVCRRWRNVALAFPQLWADIRLGASPEWAQLMLERSQEAPILLTTPALTKFPTDDIVLNVPKAQSHRLQSLSLFGNRNNFSVTRQQVEALTLPAPLLQTLVITRPGESWESYVQEPPVGLPLPVGFLGGIGCPCLHEIYLEGWTISWTSPLLHGLTSLKLSLLCFHNARLTSPRPTPFEVLDGLQSMPTLQHLELLDTVPYMGLSEDPRAVAFPHLRKLILGGTMRECSSFISHIQLPTTAVLDLQLEDHRLDTTPTSKLVEAIYSAWLSGPLSQNPLLGPGSPLTLRSWNVSWCLQGSFDLASDDNIRKLSTSLTLSGLRRPLLKDLLSSPLMQGVHTLILHGCGLPIHTLANLPSLQRISLNPECIKGFIKFARGDPSFPIPRFLPGNFVTTQPQPYRPPITYFRTLKYIHFMTIPFSDIHESHHPSKLYEFLRLRSEFGGKIELMKVRRSGQLWTEDVDLFRKVVGRVEILEPLALSEGHMVLR